MTKAKNCEGPKPRIEPRGTTDEEAGRGVVKLIRRGGISDFCGKKKRGGWSTTSSQERIALGQYSPPRKEKKRLTILHQRAGYAQRL